MRLTGCLEEMERRSLLPTDHVAVCCVGSVARGWANESSDYDFNVITRTPWVRDASRVIAVPLQPSVVPAVVLHVSGRRWEIKYWAETQVDQMISKVTWERFEEASAPAKALVETEELFLERLSTCLALGGSARLAQYKRAVSESAFRALVTTRSLAEADSSIEDAAGQLAAGDWDSAVLSARKALGHTVDALLESEGSFGSRIQKWRARRFRETQPKALSFEDYWAMETMRSFSPEAPHIWVNHVIQRCKDLALEVEI
ncbi:nucleotidyltransferase domain-containing protein [Streptomyces sp. NPDC050619]|uniref:nucleotidyltransferase domain-containing protein n=1 Tax=Streptomyces sp. NPDC050619 TaxID=3157214 RepID=UPI00341C16B9